MTMFSREKRETGPADGLSMASPWRDVIDAIRASHARTQPDKHVRPLIGMAQAAAVP